MRGPRSPSMDRHDEQRLAGVEDGAHALCGPEQLHLDLTNACTMRCLCCWHRSPLLDAGDVPPHWETRHHLPYETALGVIADAAEMGIRRIIFSGGGDPLCYPRLMELLRAARGAGMETTLITNFTLAGEGTVGELVGAGLGRLAVNLWAGDEETYAAVHPGSPPGTFGRVVELLRGLGAPLPPGKGPQLILTHVICTRNVRGIEAMVSLAVELGAGQIWFQPVDIEGPQLRPLMLSRGEIDSIRSTLEACAGNHRHRLKPGQEGLLDFGLFMSKLSNSRAAEGIFHSDVIDTMPCYMGWYECRVLANGDVVPCCKADRLPLGSVHTQRFRDIWFSPRYDEFRRKALTLPKSDPYFRNIRCAKFCDDWWLNVLVHRRYQAHRARPGTGGRRGFIRRVFAPLRRRHG